MALITSDCGASRSLGTKWSESPRIVCPSDARRLRHYAPSDVAAAAAIGKTQFADALSPSLLKHLLKGERGAAE